MKKFLFLVFAFLILLPIISTAQEIIPAVIDPSWFEWLSGILAPLMIKYKWVSIVLAVLGTLVIVGQGIVIITPTKKDDAIMAKIKAIPVIGDLLIFIERFAIFKKK